MRDCLVLGAQFVQETVKLAQSHRVGSGFDDSTQSGPQVRPSAPADLVCVIATFCAGMSRAVLAVGKIGVRMQLPLDLLAAMTLASAGGPDSVRKSPGLH